MKSFFNKLSKNNIIEKIFIITLFFFISYKLIYSVLISFSNIYDYYIFFCSLFIIALVILSIIFYIDNYSSIKIYINLKNLKYIWYIIIILSILFANLDQFLNLLKYKKLSFFSLSESMNNTLFIAIFTSVFILSFLYVFILSYTFINNCCFIVKKVNSFFSKIIFSKIVFSKNLVCTRNKYIFFLIIIIFFILFFIPYLFTPNNMPGKLEISIFLVCHFFAEWWALWFFYFWIYFIFKQIFLYIKNNHINNLKINILIIWVIFISFIISILFSFSLKLVSKFNKKLYSYNSSNYFKLNNIGKVYKMCYMNDNYIIYSSTSGSSNCNTGDVYVKKLTDDMIFCDNKNFCQNTNNENTTWNKVSTQKKEKQ